MCGKTGGGGFFREPTNFGDQPNGMQLIPCPTCAKSHAKLRALGERWLPVSVLVWVLTWLAFVCLSYFSTPRPSLEIVYFPLWGPPVFFISLSIAWRLLRIVF